MISCAKGTTTTYAAECYHKHRWVVKWLPLAATITGLALTLIALGGHLQLFYLSSGLRWSLSSIGTLLFCGGVGWYFWTLPNRPLMRIAPADAPRMKVRLSPRGEPSEFDPSSTNTSNIYEFHEQVMQIYADPTGEYPLLTAACLLYQRFAEGEDRAFKEGCNIEIEGKRLLAEIQETLAYQLDLDDLQNLRNYLHYLNSLHQ